MDTTSPTFTERATVTFCVEGLVPREMLLFKSYLRLLHEATDQTWIYQPNTDCTQADVVVVSGAFHAASNLKQDRQPQVRLILGGVDADGKGLTSWPLKPALLEKELNRLGGLVTSAKTAQNLVDAPPHSASAAQAALTFTMRLQKWPSTKLLAGTGRMRLATLLTGKGMSMDELVSRSGLPLSLCQEFVDELDHAKLLHTSMVSTTASSAAPHMQAEKSSPSKAVQPNLLDRIRMRLGIKSPSN